MLMYLQNFIVVLLLSVPWVSVMYPLVQSGEDETIVVAWWNVENLFDITNDVDRLPQFGSDDEFTPQGGREWTMNRYEQKLRNLASVIRSMNDRKGLTFSGCAK